MTDVPRLTSLSHGGGCACKLGPDELAQVLLNVPHVSDPRILVDASTRDDAAVFLISEDRAVVATVDFFAPIVDDPYSFGAIAAANAFSDLYAMGATPLFALNIVAWPRKPELLELLGEVLRGGADIAKSAGAFILGGHSIDDPEPKYGMVALGEVRPDKVITNAGARPGDHLVLTKAIGTGLLSTALKRDLMTGRDIEPAVESAWIASPAARMAATRSTRPPTSPGSGCSATWGTSCGRARWVPGSTPATSPSCPRPAMPWSSAQSLAGRSAT